MKIYFYSCKKNINTYLLTNEPSKEAILIDPCDISKYFIEKLENECFKLKAVCITRPNIEEIKRGLRSWKNIYDFSIFESMNVFGKTLDRVKNLKLSSFDIEVFCIKDASGPFCMYKIENALFTGQSLLASILQPEYLSEITTKNGEQEIHKNTIIFPFSGPPTALKNLRLMETPPKQTLDKTQEYIN